MIQSRYRHAKGYAGLVASDVGLSSPKRATSIQCRPQRSPYRGEACKRSISSSQASGEGSLANASTSSYVGLYPTRSTYAHRTSVRFSSVGEGFSPFASNFARMNESIALTAHVAFFTLGGGTRLTG